MRQYLRELPPVHELQRNSRFDIIVSTYQVRPEIVTNLIQEQIDRVRNDLLSGKWINNKPSHQGFEDYILDNVESLVGKLENFYLKKVINATGTIIHTNLGRSRLSDNAITQVMNVARNYSNLEYNLERGSRGSRHDIIEELIKKVTGAEAAMVVNNNAAAVYLILRAIAKDKEVIVSRGQLVEIGGSFRVSAIMEESGAHLVEVGTTNKTHLFDYENAIHDETAMVMKVHTSNFKTIGFTQSVETVDLVKLCKRHENLIFYEDLGSGVLFDYRKYGIGDEPIVKEVVEAGAELVSFSGDKLLGGPQAGIIVGKKELLAKLKKHQLARVLRVDKMTLAALEATLLAYLKEEEQLKQIPTVRDILEKQETIKKRATMFLKQMEEKEKGYILTLLEDVSQIGGGTMPDVVLPTYVVSVQHEKITVEDLTKQLRASTPSIIVRVKQNQILLDFRTVTEDEVERIVESFFKLA